MHSPQLQPQVLAPMSHPIRTSLNAIVGVSHLLEKTELTPLQRDYVAKITSAGHELLGLVTDMLDYSKMEAGTLAIEECDFDPAALVESVTSAAASAAAARKLRPIIELDPQLPRKLRGDRVRLRQMLLNCVNGAIELASGGDIAISVETVTRDGTGITARFLVLAQGEDPARLGQAASLAQAINQRLATLMGGAATVESGSGQGNRFSFTARLGIAAATTYELPVLPGCRALVVDDSFESRAALSDMLAGMSVFVTEARSGYEAVDELRRAAGEGMPFDMVYLDWHMPGMDGFETASRIRSLGLERAPELLIVSADGREEVMRRAAGLGIERLLLKPVLPSALFDVTIQVLAARQAVRPIPRPIERLKAAARPPDALDAIRGARVLVVDDNEINQLVAGAILEEVGVDVARADDGQQALDELAHASFDLVLMDVQMPTMDGLAATRALRARGSRTPVVALTASAGERDRQRCLEAGMDDVLTKPIEPEQLWQALLRWVPTPARSVGPRHQPAVVPAQPLLPEMAGVDLKAGLARVRGDLPLYRSLLARFVQQHAAAAVQIQDALAHGAVGQAEFLAHKVKSAAGNLGLSQVNAKSSALEGALSAYEPPTVVQRRLGELAESLEQTVAGLARVLGVGSPARA